MNKTQLVDALAAKTGLKKKDATAAVDAVFAAITEAMVAGDKVQVTGFGSFAVKRREARTGRNPHTKQEIKIPASNHCTFSASKTLKEAINK
ncbi:MAG: HU family DNA-binding protein [Clostridia bacterium]|nr:HU family DNA-binding protein [Clostridia bacterium]